MDSPSQKRLVNIEETMAELSSALVTIFAGIIAQPNFDQEAFRSVICERRESQQDKELYWTLTTALLALSARYQFGDGGVFEQELNESASEV